MEINNNAIKMLIVDDEPDILEFVRYNLEKEGFNVTTASNGQDAIKLAKKILPRLIILDIMMPGMDGVEVCRELRALPEFKDTLIVFLTARVEDYSQIAGFDVGGDDYIAKPIRPRVLISRLNALMRRAQGGGNMANDGSEDFNPHILKIGDLTIDREQFLIFRGEETIVLAKKEFELFNLLVSRPGKVFNREEIFKNVWGNDVIVGNRTIDVHIRKLREKVGERYISTMKGIGYKFEF